MPAVSSVSHSDLGSWPCCPCAALNSRGARVRALRLEGYIYIYIYVRAVMIGTVADGRSCV